jgi:hypothetical protein
MAAVQPGALALGPDVRNKQTNKQTLHLLTSLIFLSALKYCFYTSEYVTVTT